jgi:hypothetical protein
MYGVELMDAIYKSWVWALAGGVFVCCFASCANKLRPVTEAEYPLKLVGRWQRTDGAIHETMSIDGDGTFVCQLHPDGFIADTLSEGVTGTVRGTWSLHGASIRLNISSAVNENLENTRASSTIVALTEDELILTSDRGNRSSFRRVRDL